MYRFLFHAHIQTQNEYPDSLDLSLVENHSILGGSNDGAGDVRNGFIARGGRMLNEETYENLSYIYCPASQ